MAASRAAAFGATNVMNSSATVPGTMRAPRVMIRPRSATDRRRAPRYALKHLVVYVAGEGPLRWIGLGSLEMATLVDLSCTGLRVISPRELPPGKACRCEIKGEGAENGISFRARVVWCRPSVHDRTLWRIGFHIEEIDPEKLAHLNRLPEGAEPTKEDTPVIEAKAQVCATADRPPSRARSASFAEVDGDERDPREVMLSWLRYQRSIFAAMPVTERRKGADPGGPIARAQAR